MAATQRKKTDKATTTTTAAAAVAGDDDELTDQLNRAQEAVERNHAATQTLHAQWRTQLLRMAYLVMIVTLHIAQAPSSTCIKDIKVSVLDMNRHCHFCGQPLVLDAVRSILISLVPFNHWLGIIGGGGGPHSNSTGRIQN